MQATGLTNPGFVQLCGVMIVLANGFILTAMLWGAAAAFLIDRKIGATAATLGVCAVLSLFGIIHSVLPTGGVYLPWMIDSNLPFHWTAAYVVTALMYVLLSKTRAFRESPVISHDP
jgi:AGZA family xanthine/uracil permease-like MFS transporter